MVTDEEADDDLALSARVALQLIAAAQAERAAAPGKFLKAYIARRDALPAEKQVELIKQALSEANCGATIDLSAKIEDKQIVSLHVMSMHLENLDPLAGLPLENLGIQGAQGTGAPKLTDIRVIRGLPLKSLKQSSNP